MGGIITFRPVMWRATGIEHKGTLGIGVVRVYAHKPGIGGGKEGFLSQVIDMLSPLILPLSGQFLATFTANIDALESTRYGIEPVA